MASTIVGALKVILSAETAEYTTAMQKASKEASKLSADFGAIGRQMTAVGSALTKTITLPLLALGAGAIKVASDAESSFAGIVKTVDDATDAMGNLTPVGRALQQGLRDMAKEIPVNVNELNRIGEAAGQLGIKSENILGFTRVMADLGVATNLSAQEAATALAQLANITQMPQDQFDRLGSTVSGLGNDFATNESKIVDFGLRIAGAGKLAGLNEHQILAIGTAMASLGVEAEAGGTAVQKVLNDITAAVATGNSSLAVFAHTAGMSASAFAAAFRQDAAGAFEGFVSGLGKQGDAAFGTLDRLGLGNERVIRSFLSLANAGDTLSRALRVGQESWNNNTALTIEASRRYETFASQLTILGNQARDVGITLGTAMLPAMKDLIGAARMLVPVVEGLVKAFTALPGWVQGTIIGALGLAAAIGPVIWAFGTLTTSVGTVIGMFKAKGIATLALNAIMNTTIVTSGRLATALGFLGPAAAVVAVGFGAFKITGWIGEWTGFTDIVGILTTKLGELFGLLPQGAAAQYKAMRAAQLAAESAKEQTAAVAETARSYASLKNQLSGAEAQKQVELLTKAVRELSTEGTLNAAASARIATASLQAQQAGAVLSAELEQVVARFRQTSAATLQSEEDMKAAKKAADDFTKSLRALGGRDALAGAEEVVRQLHAMGGPLNVLPSKLQEMAARMREGAEAALMMGKAGLADQYTKLADTLDPIIMFQQRYNVTIGDYVTLAPTAVGWTEDLNEQLHRLGGTVTTIGPVLQSSLTFPFIQFAETVKAKSPKVKRDFDELGQSVSASLSELSNAFSQMAQVTSGKLSDTVTWLGTVVTAMNLGVKAGDSMKQGFDRLGGGMKNAIAGFAQLAAGAASAAASIMQATNSVSQSKNVMSGAASGAAIGTSIMPGWGTAIGAIAGGIIGAFRKTNQEVVKANAEIEKVKTSLIDTYGPMDQLEAKARAVGLSFAENWGHQGAAGLAAFNALVDEFTKRWEALNAELAATQTELDGLIGQASELGYIFDESGQFVGVSFDKMRAKAEEFGVDINGLGPAFQQQAMDAEALKVIDAFTLMSKAGGDVGGILAGMKDEIGQIVGDSLKFGTTIPANMQPWVEELIRTGQLVDENGVAITDFSQIKFGDPVKTEFEKISTALLEVVTKLNDILSQINAIPNSKTFTVQAAYYDPGAPNGFGSVDQGSRGDTGFATGTLGRLGNWFGSFPKAGFATALHGVEAVVTRDQAPAFAMDVLSGMGGGGGSVSVDMSGLMGEVQGLRSDMARMLKNQPRELAYAVQEAGVIKRSTR